MVPALFMATLGTALLSTSHQEPWSELEQQLREVRQTEFGASSSNEKAYETFLRMDPSSVPDHVLLAVLISGATSRDPVETARDILGEADLDLRNIGLPQIYTNVSGIGPAAMARVLAAHELARRTDLLISQDEKPTIRSSADALRIGRSLSRGPYEILSAVFLDRRNRVIGSRLITKGNDAFCIVDPKQVMRHAIELGATSIILFHQHPSGDARPSPQDEEVTIRMHRSGNILGIRLLDHIVITPTKFTSLAEMGLIPNHLERKSFTQ